MDKSIFDYQDYRAYLVDLFESRKRGEKSRIAQSINCHVAYVSQVLAGTAHFSLEQAAALSHYLEHNEPESDFFILLVSYARAGTRALESYYQKKINLALEERRILKNRLQFKKTLAMDDQAIYYSAWYYSAVHLLLTIPEFQTPQKVSRYLQLSLDLVIKVIEFLISVGLVTYHQGRYQSGEVSIHLGVDSPLLAKHHSNWRVKAIQSLDQTHSTNLNYSSVVSIAHRDAHEVRKILLQTIEKIRAIVRPSAEEGIYCYCLDLFKV